MITHKRMYVGEVIGGPMHGITLRHDFPIYRLVRPGARPRVVFDPHKQPPEPMPIQILGEYRFEVENTATGAGIWQWKTLIGPHT